LKKAHIFVKLWVFFIKLADTNDMIKDITKKDVPINQIFNYEEKEIRAQERKHE